MSDATSMSPGAVVAAWWRELHPDETGGRGDRAAAARLRRAASPNDVMMVPETIRLHGMVCRATGRERLSERQTQAVAILAGVLAGARPARSGDMRFAAMLGQNAAGKHPREGERPVYSPQRFAALLRADGAEDRLRHLRHALAVARNSAFDVARFAEDVLRWSDATRRQWIFDYHQQGRAAPVHDDTIHEEPAR